MQQTNEDLIATLVTEGVLKTPRIIQAFRAVRRKDFIAPGYEAEAYFDEALPIGYGQTISQPFTVAFMLELLSPEPGNKVLDVGAGSGWTTALLAEIVGDQGRVFGIERIPELVRFGQANLGKCHAPQASIQRADSDLGLSREAPFDRILVSAAAERFPDGLVQELRVGGVMVIPVKQSVFRIVRKSGRDFQKEEFFGFSFVPLVEKS